MDSAAINSFIPTLDQVDSWSEILTLLPILIILELLLSADNAIALASLTKSLDSPLLRSKALDLNKGLSRDLVRDAKAIALSADSNNSKIINIGRSVRISDQLST